MRIPFYLRTQSPAHARCACPITLRFSRHCSDRTGPDQMRAFVCLVSVVPLETETATKKAGIWKRQLRFDFDCSTTKAAVTTALTVQYGTEFASFQSVLEYCFQIGIRRAPVFCRTSQGEH